MLTICVRRIRPGEMLLPSNAIVRVLVGNQYETRRADALVLGDLVEGQGVVTAVRQVGAEAA